MDRDGAPQLLDRPSREDGGVALDDQIGHRVALVLRQHIDICRTAGNNTA